MDDAIGGGTLLSSVREDLQLVVSMLRNAAYPEDVGRRLHGVAAGMGRLAGWLAYESDQHVLAQRFWLRAAHASDERAGRRAQEHAESLLARSVVSDEPAWVYWFTEAELGGVAGAVSLEFGKPAEAGIVSPPGRRADRSRFRPRSGHVDVRPRSCTSGRGFIGIRLRRGGGGSDHATSRSTAPVMAVTNL